MCTERLQTHPANLRMCTEVLQTYTPANPTAYATVELHPLSLFLFITFSFSLFPFVRAFCQWPILRLIRTWPTPRIAWSQLKKPKAKESPLKRFSLFWLEPRTKFFLVKLKLDLLYIYATVADSFATSFSASFRVFFPFWLAGFLVDCCFLFGGITVYNWHFLWEGVSSMNLKNTVTTTGQWQKT